MVLVFSFYVLPIDHLLCGIVVAKLNLSIVGTEMTDNHDNSIEGENPIASLSHDQKIQFTTARYLGDVNRLVVTPQKQFVLASLTSLSMPSTIILQVGRSYPA